MVWNINTLMPLFPVCFLLIGLTVTVVLDPYISKKHRVIMFIIIALSLTLELRISSKTPLRRVRSAGFRVPPHPFTATRCAP